MKPKNKTAVLSAGVHRAKYPARARLFDNLDFGERSANNNMLMRSGVGSGLSVKEL
ncbi:MAG: hypothetical protein AAGD92_02065 [Pseudomonadota bacterium]